MFAPSGRGNMGSEFRMCFVSFYVTLRDNMFFFRDTNTQSHETIKHVLIYVLLT